MKPDAILVTGPDTVRPDLARIALHAYEQGEQVMVLSPELNQQTVLERLQASLDVTNPADPTPEELVESLIQDTEKRLTPEQLLVRSLAAPFLAAFEQNLERQNRPSRLPTLADSKLPKPKKRTDKPWKKGKKR